MQKKRRGWMVILAMMLVILMAGSCSTIQNAIFRLRDLGLEGDLSNPNHVYRIVDNRTETGNWLLYLHSQRLPIPYLTYANWWIVFKGERYDFAPSVILDIYEIQILDPAHSMTKEAILNAEFNGAPWIFELSFNASPFLFDSIKTSSEF